MEMPHPLLENSSSLGSLTQQHWALSPRPVMHSLNKHSEPLLCMQLIQSKGRFLGRGTTQGSVGSPLLTGQWVGL